MTCGVSLGLDPTLLRCSPLGFVVPDTTCKKKEKKEKKKETETKTETITTWQLFACTARDFIKYQFSNSVIDVSHPCEGCRLIQIQRIQICGGNAG